MQKKIKMNSFNKPILNTSFLLSLSLDNNYPIIGLLHQSLFQRGSALQSCVKIVFFI